MYQGNGGFAPLAMLGDLKHCLGDSLSPGATATLKSSFYSLLTKAESFLPLQTGDISILEAGLSLGLLSSAYRQPASGWKGCQFP